MTMGTPFSHSSSSWASTSGGSCRSDIRTMTASPLLCRIACVANHLDVGVGGSDFAEDGESSVARRVVDENVLVPVFTQAQHQAAHTFVNFPDVTFLIKAGRDYTDGFHIVECFHLPPPALAA